jgi:methylenetetrahydrofolate reductase (NADPH)
MPRTFRTLFKFDGSEGPSATPALDLAQLKARAVAFLRNVSTEVCPHDEPRLASLVGVLPAGTTVYVAHTPRAQMLDVVRVAAKLQSLGFRASPHCVARRIPSEATLREGLAQARAAGIEQLLLVAGDLSPPAGPFTSTLELLDSGAITDAGITHLGVAGHPESHPVVDTETLWQALAYKQAFAQRTGVKVHIVSQFSFNPGAVAEWDRQLQAHAITLPVHVGIAGPTPAVKLLKFAAMCGIGATGGSLWKNTANMTKLATGMAMAPDEMLLAALANGAGTVPSRLVQPHYYAFGGVMETARWLRHLIDGTFTMDNDGRKFTVNN